MSDHILYEVDGGVATLTINRPEKKNALTIEMSQQFLEIVEGAGEDDGVRVLIVTGTRGAFCAGVDLQDLATAQSEGRGPDLRDSSGSRGQFGALVACPKPIIGAIDGPAVGMGAEYTCQCDIRIVGPRARFAWNFAHRGLLADLGAGTWLLPRQIGPARALRLLYEGSFLSAEEAVEIGYADRLVASEDLLDEARKIADSIMQGSPFSHSRHKALVYEGLGSDLGSH
ncbi:MAG: enoyl-CoA hydratase/isomerase family protein, partial [Deltaproteobacteria bacterium]|nr:enoyl-CoA hydratase/isomerase family protein [Deltaproteobacteria bacterium]